MSSLFSALTAAVSGVSAQSEALGNISDNIANANTTGFKSISTEFSSLVTASNAASNNPGGVRATPQYNNDVQGNISSSTTATSLAISGQGYFAVETAAADASGATNFTGSTYYTREGDFTLDKSGYLVNGSGYYLLGYSINSDGTVNTSSTSPIQVSALVNNPVATTSATYTANLPSSASVGYTSSASSVDVYDALGNTHQMSYTWTKTGQNTWALSVDVSDGAVDSNGNTVDYTATVPFTFNNDTNAGTPESIASGIKSSVSGQDVTFSDPVSAPQNVSVTVGSSTYTYAVKSGDTASDVASGLASLINADIPGTTATGDVLSVAGSTAPTVATSGTDYTVASGSKAQISIPLTFGGASQSLTLNFGDYNSATGLTQYSDSSVSVTSFEQNGLAKGSYSSLSIDSSGIVSINYTNGSVREIAQIPIVQFYAQDQLQRVSGNAYSATLASGTARYNLAGTSGAGTISSSSLESSNVDIATQFTDMVTAQQVYSANAKVITTVNQMLNVIVNAVQ